MTEATRFLPGLSPWRRKPLTAAQESRQSHRQQ